MRSWSLRLAFSFLVVASFFGCKRSDGRHDATSDTWQTSEVMTGTHPSEVEWDGVVDSGGPGEVGVLNSGGQSDVPIAIDGGNGTGGAPGGKEAGALDTGKGGAGGGSGGAPGSGCATGLGGSSETGCATGIGGIPASGGVVTISGGGGGVPGSGGTLGAGGVVGFGGVVAVGGNLGFGGILRVGGGAGVGGVDGSVDGVAFDLDAEPSDDGVNDSCVAADVTADLSDSSSDAPIEIDGSTVDSVEDLPTPVGLDSTVADLGAADTGPPMVGCLYEGTYTIPSQARQCDETVNPPTGGPPCSRVCNDTPTTVNIVVADGNLRTELTPVPSYMSFHNWTITANTPSMLIATDGISCFTPAPGSSSKFTLNVDCQTGIFTVNGYGEVNQPYGCMHPTHSYSLNGSAAIPCSGQNPPPVWCGNGSVP